MAQGVVTTYVDDLLLTGWQHHITAIAKARLGKHVMKRSGSRPYEIQGEKSTENESEGIDFLVARITRDADGTVWCDQSNYVVHCLQENGFFGADMSVSLRKVPLDHQEPSHVHSAFT